MNIDSFRAIYKRQLNETTNLTVNYGYQELEQSSQFEIDGGVNYQYGMAFNINRLLTESNVLDATSQVQTKNGHGLVEYLQALKTTTCLPILLPLNGHDFFGNLTGAESLQYMGKRLMREMTYFLQWADVCRTMKRARWQKYKL